MSQLIGEILLRNGAIRPDDLEEALAWQVLYGGRLGTNLLELGLVNEEALAVALGQQHGCEHAFGELELSNSMAQMIPPVLARRHELFPWRLEDRRLKVITADPASSLEILDDLSFRSGRTVRPVVAPEYRVHQLLRRHFESLRQMRALDFGQKVVRKKPGAASVHSTQEELEDAPDLMDDEQFAALYAHAMQGGVAPGGVGPGGMQPASQPTPQPLSQPQPETQATIQRPSSSPAIAPQNSPTQNSSPSRVQRQSPPHPPVLTPIQAPVTDLPANAPSAGSPPASQLDGRFRQQWPGTQGTLESEKQQPFSPGSSSRSSAQTTPSQYESAANPASRISFASQFPTQTSSKTPSSAVPNPDASRAAHDAAPSNRWLRSRAADFSVAPPGQQQVEGQAELPARDSVQKQPGALIEGAGLSHEELLDTPFIKGELLEGELLSDELLDERSLSAQPLEEGPEELEEGSEFELLLETPREVPRVQLSPRDERPAPTAPTTGQPSIPSSRSDTRSTARGTAASLQSGPSLTASPEGIEEGNEALAQSLAAAFQQLEQELEPTQPVSLESEDSPLSFQEALQAIAQADGREVVARAVLRYARSRAARAVLLSVQGNVALGWDAVGEDLSASVARRIAVSLSSPSAFRLVRESRSHYLGPLGKESGNVRFLKLAGKKWPSSALLLPVLFSGRVVYILYVDNGHRQYLNTDLGELLILSQSISRSMESLVSRRAMLSAGERGR